MIHYITWIVRPFGDDFRILTMISSEGEQWGRDEIYPDWWYVQNDHFNEEHENQASKFFGCPTLSDTPPDFRTKLSMPIFIHRKPRTKNERFNGKKIELHWRFSSEACLMTTKNRQRSFWTNVPWICWLSPWPGNYAPFFFVDCIPMTQDCLVLLAFHKTI